MKRLIVMFILGSFLFAGCTDMIKDQFENVDVSAVHEKYCTEDDDCGCGIHKTKEECFYGNKKYVDLTKNCPDFCDGIAGDLELRCIEFECTQVHVEK